MGEAQLLPWDSDWLGFPVARLAARLGQAVDMPATVAQCQASGIRLLYLVLDPADAGAAAAARTAGACLADIKLTYQLLLPAPELPEPASAGIQLTRAAALTPTLERLAWQSGEYSRFRRDAQIGALAFETLYTRWLRQALAQGTVWAASNEDNETVGLLAFDTHGSAAASIELLAVAPAARRQRIGHLLVQAAQQEAYRLGHATLRVVTQAANQPAWQFYERCGFQLISTEHYYHLWL